MTYLIGGGCQVFKLLIVTTAFNSSGENISVASSIAEYGTRAQADAAFTIITTRGNTAIYGSTVQAMNGS